MKKAYVERLNFKESLVSLGHFCCLSRNIEHVVVIYKLTNIQWRFDGDFLDKSLRQIAVKLFAFSNFSLEDWQKQIIHLSLLVFDFFCTWLPVLIFIFHFLVRQSHWKDHPLDHYKDYFKTPMASEKFFFIIKFTREHQGDTTRSKDWPYAGSHNYAYHNCTYNDWMSWHNEYLKFQNCVSFYI